MHSSPAATPVAGTIELTNPSLIGHPVKVITHIDGMWWEQVALSYLDRDVKGRKLRFRRGVIVSMDRKTAVVQIGTRLQLVELERLRVIKANQGTELTETRLLRAKAERLRARAEALRGAA